jgi:hypothetical protein
MLAVHVLMVRCPVRNCSDRLIARFHLYFVWSLKPRHVGSMSYRSPETIAYRGYHSMKNILQRSHDDCIHTLGGGFQVDLPHSDKDRTLAESVFEAPL